MLCVLSAPAPVGAQGMGMPAPPEMNPVTKKPRILDKVGIEQRIGQQLPLDTPFVDDHGRQVRLGDFFGSRPVVMALAYFECPMLCTQVLNGMTGSLKTMNFTPGKDYDVVVISINPREGPMLASEKKQAYVGQFGRPETGDDVVKQAARTLGTEEMILKLPDGYATKVSERGGNFSAGERQLICFTRAMVAQPRMLILDEATSAVDPQTETIIQHALETLFEKRTSIVIAHRLSTVRRAQQILVLREGKIIERGTHEQLLQLGQEYQRLYHEFTRH